MKDKLVPMHPRSYQAPKRTGAEKAHDAQAHDHAASASKELAQMFKKQKMAKKMKRG